MSEPDWFLAFVTRVKHEDLYIREWLEYHLLVGVEHFFLYDMDGGQGLAGILEPYEDVIGPLRAFDPNRVRGIRVPRFNFGHSGHERRPPGLVIESYLRREATRSSQKDMANGEKMSGNYFRREAHGWSYSFRKRGALVSPDQVKTLLINHYFTKSFEEFQIRQNDNRTWRQGREQFDDRNRRRNDVNDNGMLRFAPEIRGALGLRPPTSPDS